MATEDDIIILIVAKKVIQMSEKKKILVVDDDSTLQTMLRMGLENCGYRVFLANNGREGLEKIQSEKLDLIITDILMPVMDGYTFYKEVRRNKATESIPVLMLTVKNNMRDALETLGVNFFLSKPFDPDQLLATISKLFSSKQAATTSEELGNSLVP